jgi:hypothetical protein
MNHITNYRIANERSTLKKIIRVGKWMVRPSSYAGNGYRGYYCYNRTEKGNSMNSNFDVIKLITDVSNASTELGDHALFGKSTQAMKAQWRVPASRPLADFAPTIILKAKDFATEITIHNAREHQMATESEISREHVNNNDAVRQTLLNRGIRPESLPAAEDVKKVERRLNSDEKKSLKNPERLD